VVHMGAAGTGAGTDELHPVPFPFLLRSGADYRFCACVLPPAAGGSPVMY
jgi:hypothetical protein